MYDWLLRNHILTNLVFLLVIAAGIVSFLTLPRQQDPSVNFNWVEIHTRFPGASAADVEKRVTDVLEKGVEQVRDIRFSRSESRAGFSRIIVRFRDLDEDEFDAHVTDLRREIQNRSGQLPDAAEASEFLQVNSDNSTPAVLMLVVGQAYDENLRREADRVADDLERLSSVDRVDRMGLREPELQVLFDASRMQGLGVSPAVLSDTVRAYFRDRAIGSLALGNQDWLVRLSGTRNDPAYLENLPLLSTQGEVPVRSVARVRHGFSEPNELIEYEGKPAVLLPVYKDENASLLDMVDRVKGYAAGRNDQVERRGVSIVLLDDQTDVTRGALSVMENNAMVGLVLVLLAIWALLGLRIAISATLGIPFALAATLTVALLLGESLNVVVLLGLVISLGMLVDDAVVVAEAIHDRLARGERPIEAAHSAMAEVGAPVFASVLTTMAAFLPLMLIPGVLGDFMYVAPLVVTIALLASLVESFWMLPSHIATLTPAKRANTGRMERWRGRARRWIRNRYSRIVIAGLRHPRVLTLSVIVLLVSVVGTIQLGLVRIDYFATDSARLFYINIDMPPGTSLEKTLATTTAVERAVRPGIRDDELSAVASYAGLQMAQADTVMSDNVGQVAVSLEPKHADGRSVSALIESIEDAAQAIPGTRNLSFLEVRTGPPTAAPVSVKLRGDDLAQLASASTALQGMLAEMDSVRDIRDDDVARRMELQLQLDPDALVRTGLDPGTVTRALQLLADGEIVASMRDSGDTIAVRVRSRRPDSNPLNEFLDTVINLPEGGTVAVRQLVDTRTEATRGSIRHQNFRRAITVSAELAGTQSNTLSVNREIRTRWAADYASQYPGVELDFSGETDDIKQSLQSLAIFFLFGVVLIYTILGTQFRSYFQPLIVLGTVPTAFAGVVIGAALSGQALSLYTLYGTVALAGVAVNTAIVFISAANERRAGGLTIAQATVFAARRRVVPILITSITTMAGLLSLATGFAGKSNIWGPVASAIVWGLAVSTLLTLLITPALYARFAPGKRHKLASLPLPPALESPRGIFAWLRTASRGEWAQQQRYRSDRHSLLADRDLKAAYQQGREALLGSDYLTALKQFQSTADTAKDNVLANRAAAHAAIAVLLTDGWDSGYDARIRRFLQRGLRQSPHSPDLVALRQLYEEIKANEVESPSGTEPAPGQGY